jgi:hypothetical protein
MFPKGDRTVATYATYNYEAIIAIRQYVKECGRPDILDMDYADICAAAVTWTLSQHYRWQKNHIRKKCAGLRQFLENLVACELVSSAEGTKLIYALECQRPFCAQQGIPVTRPGVSRANNERPFGRRIWASSFAFLRKSRIEFRHGSSDI